MPSPRFLIIGLGNPKPLHETFHSAGNLALRALQQHLGQTQSSFVSERFGKKATLVSIGPKYTLLQSPVLMNISGPWASRAWKDCVANPLINPSLTPAGLGLVIVHDELESALGVVKTREWLSSHKGHNGIKSVQTSLPISQYKNTLQGTPWVRISIGIDRPEARDPQTVANYVLRPVSQYQKSVIEDSAARALQALEQVEKKWLGLLEAARQNDDTIHDAATTSAATTVSVFTTSTSS